jgi:hypothetical protein
MRVKQDAGFLWLEESVVAWKWLEGMNTLPGP